MANVKISALPAVTTVVPGTDVLPLVSGGITTKATPTQILAAALNNPQVISVSSASDALRITQAGAGNALVVEDSANPDSTPFVVYSSGKAIVGHTSALATVAYTGAALTPNLQTQGVGMGVSAFGVANWANSAQSPASMVLSKSKSNTIGTFGLVSSGDVLGSLSFTGDDGTAFINAAFIQAQVDGTPGTNDMPGRLVFSTTADGANSPTERMRIDNAGRVGIGFAASAGETLRIQKNITGATVGLGVNNIASIQSDVTASARVYNSYVATAAASFTLTQIIHYRTEQGAFGAGSTVTNQYGYLADASLTGATNNYGFFSNIASGTGRYNFYATGTAANYFNGDLTIYGGTAIPAGGTAGVGYKFSSTSNLGVFFGSGAPTLAAAQGSLYVRTDGSSIATRLYVNTNGSTTWTNVVTAA